VKASEVSEDYRCFVAEITVWNLRVSPTLPFAGTSVPAEGVLHFVEAILQSRSLEDGLRVLLETVIGDQAIEAGLWVWPEPSVTAMGLLGTARLYEVRSHELASVPPPEESLVEWTQRAVSAGPLTVIPLGISGAICLPSLARLSPAQQLWFGTWLEWLATREHQFRDAKLKSLAEFAAGAGHEINNPLGTILGRSQLLLRQESDPERRRWLAAIGGQALRIRDMISDTMVFARPPAPKPRVVEIEPLIHSVTDRFAEELLSSGIELRLNMGGGAVSGQPSAGEGKLSRSLLSRPRAIPGRPHRTAAKRHSRRGEGRADRPARAEPLLARPGMAGAGPVQQRLRADARRARICL
jgi:signal transduction histidine kinase